MADGDHEVPADEDVDLAELDLLDVVEVAGRPQDDEQRVAVAFELRPLVGDDRVLDRQLVQVELPRHRGELLRRPVQADPSHRPRLVAQPHGGAPHAVVGLVDALGPRDRRRDRRSPLSGSTKAYSR